MLSKEVIKSAMIGAIIIVGAISFQTYLWYVHTTPEEPWIDADTYQGILKEVKMVASDADYSDVVFESRNFTFLHYTAYQDLKLYIGKGVKIWYEDDIYYKFELVPEVMGMEIGVDLIGGE